ncbi:MAG: glycosyltransferase family 4 protein [Acholeplasmatales bacterium]|nr:glycosyltransferase family 4 protein [Acholeplasmatales bacterium]
MKKMLFITPQFPFPLDNGGKKGALNGIETVSKCYDVTVVSFCEDFSRVDEGLSKLNQMFPNVKFIKPINHPIHIRNKKFLLLKTLFKGFIIKKPYLTVKFINKQMKKVLCSLFSDSYFDVVFIDYINVGYYFDYIKKSFSGKYGRIFFKDHNIEYQLVEQEMNKNKGIKKSILKYEYKQTYKYEKRLVLLANICYTVSDQNTNILKKYNENTYTMNPVYKENNMHNLTDNNNILYIGNLSWNQNLIGLNWFVEKVFPSIKAEISDAKLVVAGSGGKADLFCNVCDVDYLGFVDDLQPLYKNSKVFIVPLFDGSGIRIKILDALNNHIAIVSTPKGCEGLKLCNEKEIMIASDEKGFADYIIELLRNYEKNNNIRNAGLEYLMKNYYLLSVQEKFENTIR